MALLNKLISFLFFLVVWLPMYFGSIIHGWLEQIKYQSRVKNIRRVSRWIAENLRAKDIVVHGDCCTERSCGCDPSINNLYRVYAEVKPEQVIDYQNVYAEAIAKFPKLTPAQICGGAVPPEPLDRNWAGRIGITEYFDREIFLPCANCKIQQPSALRWGNEASHAKYFWRVAHLDEQETECVFPDGAKKIIKGYLCINCKMKFDPFWEPF